MSGRGAAAGDRVLVRQGEVVAVDGRALGRLARPQHRDPDRGGDAGPPAGRRRRAVRASTNTGEAFDLLAERPAAESTFAGIVRLVEQAQASRAPMARLAYRWALGFLGLTLALCAAAYAMTEDPRRVLAVLVVATPCPLILAVPVALVAGLSRAARAGVLVKSGAALETLARVRVADPRQDRHADPGGGRLAAVVPLIYFDATEVLRLAAALDQASGHVLATALVTAARDRGLDLPTPECVREVPGAGIAGLVEGQAVALGGPDFVGGGFPDEDGHAAGASRVLVTVEGVPAGVLVLADPLREDAPAMLAAARGAGIRRVVLLSGDQAAVAEAVGQAVGADAVLAERSPAEKVAAVLREKPGGPVLMLGDGVNDAPALAAADIGVAMGARGAAASAEAADAVVLVDPVDRLAEAMRIARRAPADRAAERRRRDRAFGARHDRGRGRAVDTGRRGGVAGSDRRHRDSQRPPRPAGIEKERPMPKLTRLAILDDYQGVALSRGPWDRLPQELEIAVFRDTITDPDALAARLAPFDAILMMRERTAFLRPLLERLPNLRLLITTGARNRSIDRRRRPSAASPSAARRASAIRRWT